MNDETQYILRSFYIATNVDQLLAARAGAENISKGELVRRFLDECLGIPEAPVGTDLEE